MRRLGIAAAAALVVAAGLAIHWNLKTAAGDFLADGLYAALIYLLVCFAVPRLWPAAAGSVAVAFCAGVEFLQLTGAPAVWAAAFPPIALVLGTTFGHLDLAAYILGATAASLCDAVVRWVSGRLAVRRAAAMDGTHPGP